MAMGGDGAKGRDCQGAIVPKIDMGRGQVVEIRGDGARPPVGVKASYAR